MANKHDGDEPSHRSRAMWVFLGYMLVGPFFAGLAVVVMLALAPLLGMQAWLPADTPPVGVAGVTAFVWAALPSAVAAAIIMPRVLRVGRFGWIEAGIAGVIGFSAVALFTDAVPRELFGGLAFAAGLVSAGVQKALESGGVIRADEA